MGGAEIRFVLDGRGVFDIRDRDDAWVRIEVEKGDLIIVVRITQLWLYLQSEFALRACVLSYLVQQGGI